MATTQASRRLGFGDAIKYEGLSNLHDIFTHGGHRGVVGWRDETASKFASRWKSGRMDNFRFPWS